MRPEASGRARLRSAFFSAGLTRGSLREGILSWMDWAAPSNSPTALSSGSPPAAPLPAELKQKAVAYRRANPRSERFTPAVPPAGEPLV